jgi:hypothetical protein
MIGTELYLRFPSLTAMLAHGNKGESPCVSMIWIQAATSTTKDRVAAALAAVAAAS